MKPSNGNDSEIIPILRRISGQKKAKAFFMRKVTANLMEKLDNTEQDAMVQIALAWKILNERSSYQQWRYGEVIQGAGIEDYSQFALDMMERFRTWSRFLTKTNPDALGVCVSICLNEDSVKELSKCRGMRHMKIMISLKEGLKEWAQIAGW